MLKEMKPGNRYFVINIDEPYAWKIYDVLKAGQIKKGEWPEGDITFEEWIDQTFGKGKSPRIIDVLVKITADAADFENTLAKLQKTVAGLAEPAYCEDCQYWYGPGGVFTPPCKKINGHVSTYRSKKPTYLIPEIANGHNDCGSYEKKERLIEVEPEHKKGFWRGLMMRRHK